MLRINDLLARFWLRPVSTAHITLFHASYETTPTSLADPLHNVDPAAAFEQIEWLGRFYDFMSVDDWFSAGRPAGKIAITVDDGYRCTLRNLVSALAAENIPITVFLCGRALQGGLLWRDKVRALITTDTIVPFLEWVEQRNVPLLLGKSDFYRVSKSPTVHSPTLETAINEYVEEKAGWLRDIFDALVAEFADTAELIDDPNISYGNHTFNHYVMASLSAAEQEREIVDNELFLNGLGVRRSRVFALPFGRSADYNETTVQMCKQAGLRGFLLSDHRVNFTRSRTTPIPWTAHRYMMPGQARQLRRRTFQMTWVAPVKNLLRPFARR